MLSQHKRYWAEIDTGAAEDNFHIIKSKLNPKTKLCCIIKADAYGHGAAYMAKLYETLGADYLAVSNIEEAIQLRKSGIKISILILGYTNPECAYLLSENNIEQCVFSEDFAEELNRCAEKYGVKVKIHLKMDSGMGRIGFSCKHLENDAEQLAAALRVCKMGNLIPFGIFTHFAVADEGEDGREYTKKQFESFVYSIKFFENSGITFNIRHCSNSAAIFAYPEYQLDMVRAGIVLYGYPPSEKVETKGLKPVMSLISLISHIKDVYPGDYISYGCTFRADKKIRVATVPVGYADGFWRSNSKGGELLAGGKRAPILGRVCMDQLMIDISGIENVAPQSKVVVMGKMNGEKIDADELAENNGTINYEILCAVGKRVPRIYIKDNKTIHIEDNILDI